MMQYVPMFILMGVFGAIGVYWTFGASHFINWTRRYKSSFPKFSDQGSMTVNHSGGISAKISGGLLLNTGIRLTGIVLAGVAVSSIIMIING